MSDLNVTSCLCLLRNALRLRVMLAAFTLGILALVAACSNQDVDPAPVDQVKKTTPVEKEHVPQTSTHSPPRTDPAPTHPMQDALSVEEAVVFSTAQRKASASVANGRIARAQQAAPLGYMGPPPHNERYEAFDNNGVKWVDRDPVSTFSIDVDTASYANMRRQVNQGQLPHADSIRVEELINYFQYGYVAPQEDLPFGIFTEMGPSPWDANRKLLHIGIKSQIPDQSELPPANLVFLIDVSGSMQAANKLPLLKNAMKMLTNQLRDEDRIAIVVYAGAAGKVLEPTPGSNKMAIHAAIDGLTAGGSTNGGAGIHLAYNLAQQSYLKGGINRVLLATDGDFNVGTTDDRSLKQLIETKRASGIALSVMGFGTGNYNDQLMQTIAQVGNGNAAYIDTIGEARKVLVEEFGATLNMVAKDTKVQIEFNPEVVETYRLIGYETRHLNREDFNNDTVDAGEIGAGHTVTALYEITLNGDTPVADPLRYGASKSELRADQASAELAYLKVRYKAPNADNSQLIEQPLYVRDIESRIDNTSADYRFASAVAWFGQVLRNNPQVQNQDFDSIINTANGAKGQDTHGYRSEFVNLVRTVAALNPPKHVDLSQK